MNALRILIAIVALLAAAAAAGADAVRLRASASLGPGPVHLADIATLEGPEAERFAAVQIEPDALAAAGERRVFQIDLAQVRGALEREGAHWGRLALSGGTCIVRLTHTPAPSAAPQAGSADEPRHAPVTLEGPPTIRTRIGALLVELFDVPPSDLRLLFDARDEELLDAPQWGRRIDLQPNSTSSSGRQSITVRIFEGERLLETRTMRVDALLRRPVLRLAAGVPRGEAIRAEHITAQSLWVDPAGEAPVGSLEDAMGMRTRTRLTAGDILRIGDIEAPILVRRGERVTVHCISGGVALRVKARAQADARLGELVECRIDGRRSGFSARVSGPALAVVNLDARSKEDAR